MIEQIKNKLTSVPWLFEGVAHLVRTMGRAVISFVGLVGDRLTLRAQLAAPLSMRMLSSPWDLWMGTRMKAVGSLVIVAVVLLALPAAAQVTAGATTASTAGVFDRVWYAVTGSGHAGRAPDDAKQQGDAESKNASRNAAAEPAPMKMSGADTSDKDSYKPDAGDSYR
jgi:hypothetical protein